MAEMITAAMVKELRERTGSGMMECKKALVDAHGDIELAITQMREAGQAKAVKKAGRIAAEGVIAIRVSADGKTAMMLEINSETDFVAKDGSFLAFVDAVANVALATKASCVESLGAALLSSGQSVEEARRALISTIGENITIRRVVCLTFTQPLGVYAHGIRIGVLVAVDPNAGDVAKDIAMHIAASRPEVIAAADVDAARLAAEKAIFIAQSKDENKPAAIIEKMTEGRLKKFVNEISLLGQPFVKQPDITVEQLLKQSNAKVVVFHRFEVGEGIEKKQENFRDEVMAQVKGA